MLKNQSSFKYSYISLITLAALISMSETGFGMDDDMPANPLAGRFRKLDPNSEPSSKSTSSDKSARPAPVPVLVDDSEAETENSVMPSSKKGMLRSKWNDVNRDPF